MKKYKKPVPKPFPCKAPRTKRKLKNLQRELEKEVKPYITKEVEDFYFGRFRGEPYRYTGPGFDHPGSTVPDLSFSALQCIYCLQDAWRNRDIDAAFQFTWSLSRRVESIANVRFFESRFMR